MKDAVVAAVILYGLSAPLAAETSLELAARADLACVKAHAVGVCRRNTPPYVGVRMRFWQPVLLIETTRQPGRSGISDLEPYVRAGGGGAGLDFFDRSAKGPTGGAGSPGQTDTTVLQMTEAHVFAFPFATALSVGMEAPCEGPPDLSGPVSYLSEQDGTQWREARQEKDDPMSRMTARAAPLCDRFGSMLPGLCVGTWGPLYPRTGFSVNASEPAASALAAFRAADIASLKSLTPHRVVLPLLFWPSVRQDRMQMLSPSVTRCLAIGEDPGGWEQGRRSVDGRYVWAYWRRKECCLF